MMGDKMGDLLTSVSCTPTMPRARYDIVPESDTEIVEEVTYRQKTKRGTKLKTTRTVVRQPTSAKTKTASGSQSKTRKQVQASEVEEEPSPGNNTDLPTYEVVGDLEYQPEYAVEDAEPLANVCSSCLCASVLIVTRALWTSSFSIGANTSIGFLKWRVTNLR